RSTGGARKGKAPRGARQVAEWTSAWPAILTRSTRMSLVRASRVKIARPSSAITGPIMTHTKYETDGPLAILTFNRPEARNAMTWEVYDAHVEARDKGDRDASIRVLILRGAGGKAFVAETAISQFQHFAAREDGLKY